MEIDSVLLQYTLTLERFCDYQERCTYEVKEKMRKLDVPSKYHEVIIEHLNENAFYDDARFALAFAKGKFSYKHWGRIKIAHALKAKRINHVEISAALSALDEEEYYEVLLEIANQKAQSLGGMNDNVKVKKVLNNALQKGFESRLIWKVIKEIKNNTL